MDIDDQSNSGKKLIHPSPSLQDNLDNEKIFVSNKEEEEKVPIDKN